MVIVGSFVRVMLHHIERQRQPFDFHNCRELILMQAYGCTIIFYDLVIRILYSSC